MEFLEIIMEVLNMKRLLMISLLAYAFCGVSAHAMDSKKASSVELNTKKAPYSDESGQFIPVLYKAKAKNLQQEAVLKVTSITGRKKSTNGYELKTADGLIVGFETVGEKNVSLQNPKYPEQYKQIFSDWITNKKVELKSNLLKSAQKNETPKLSKKFNNKNTNSTTHTSDNSDGSFWKKATWGGLAVTATLLVTFVLYKYLKR